MQHQIEGIEFLKKNRYALLADQPGLGKSAQTLLAAKEPVLVVAPAMVIDSGTWDDEIAKWAPGMDVTQISYSSLTSREKTPNGGTKPTGDLKPEFRRQWGTVIADEAHYLKGRKTNWTIAFQKLKADRIYQVTGTPLPNWAHEAYIPLKLAYPGDERFRSYWRWVKEWFTVAPTKWSPMAVGELRSDRTWEEFRKANWGDRMLLRLREDCLDLPPLTLDVWKTKMIPEQAKIYKNLKKDFVAWLESGTEVVAWNSAAQLIKLAKCATGLEILDRDVFGSGKLNALKSILKDRPRPTLVVAYFRDSVAACARVAEEIGADVRIIDGGTSKKARLDGVRAFQSGKLPVLCATIDTISEGMTLTAADQIIRVERSWRPSRNEQVIRRLHRIGQERPVSVIDLVAENTVDERVLLLLKQKTDVQMRALGVGDLRGLVS